MARMMDALILENLAPTPFAFTKITTHQPNHRQQRLAAAGGNAMSVKKATSHNHLPHANGNGGGNNSGLAFNIQHNPTTLRVNLHKKIPTQGNS